MLYISDNLRIDRLDEYNIIVEEQKEITAKKTKEKRLDWCRVGYYATVEQACFAILNKKIAKSVAECSTVDEILSSIIAAKLEISKAVKEG